jgi:hypothetical protein
MRQYPTTQERFWRRVEMRGPDECWPWAGHVNADGYGTFPAGSLKPNRTETMGAHRASYQLAHPGTDLTGLVVRHSCDNPPCVNPAHLLLGRQTDNIRDMDERGRRVNPKSLNTHCAKGHAFTPENTYIRPGFPTHRHCRACINAHNAAVTEMRRKKRAENPILRTHCKRGHEWVPQNIKVDTDGHSRCAPCQRLRGREWWAARQRR